ncbi:MAG: dienelactone hydrolase family protein [Geminicoccaceae bacterium]
MEGDLCLPGGARDLVRFAHGSGSSRKSPCNREVARALNRAGLATLLMDMLTADEVVVDVRTAQLRFDIGLLAKRLVEAADWLARQPVTRSLRLGCFGASTGVAPGRRICSGSWARSTRWRSWRGTGSRDIAVASPPRDRPPAARLTDRQRLASRAICAE